MKRISETAIIIFALLFLTSCVHTNAEFEARAELEMTILSDDITATITIGEELPTALQDEPQTKQEAEPEAGRTSYPVGVEGPNGGLVFECDGVFLEIGEPLYEAPSYQHADDYCKRMGYRLPSMAELSSIYSQLVETALSELEYTYYWSSETIDSQSARILNFDTGFEGTFFMDMDFVSAVPVIEL